MESWRSVLKRLAVLWNNAEPIGTVTPGALVCASRKRTGFMLSTMGTNTHRPSGLILG